MSFSSKIVNVPPTIAEIIAIIQGLTLCWNYGFRKVNISTDCTAAINLIQRGSARIVILLETLLWKLVYCPTEAGTLILII